MRGHGGTTWYDGNAGSSGWFLSSAACCSFVHLHLCGTRNRLQTDYWDEFVYLRSRSPLPIHSNYYGLDRLDPVVQSQLGRAANFTAAVLSFWGQLHDGTLDVNRVADAIPLCMNQYQRIFGGVRVPGKVRPALCGGSLSAWHCGPTHHGGPSFHVFRTSTVLSSTAPAAILSSLGAINTTKWTSSTTARCSARTAELCPRHAALSVPMTSGYPSLARAETFAHLRPNAPDSSS